ncbi:MAG: acetylxylan esterase [Planctomycetia bacterium]|nr:acetylxylan esterase [Planctomycetia bacterium]
MRLFFSFHSILMIAMFICSDVFSAEYSFFGKTDKENPLTYQPGETMIFEVEFRQNGKPVDGQKLFWKRRGDDEIIEQGEAISSSSEPLRIKTSLAIPGFVHVMVWAEGIDGWDDVRFNGGAGVNVDQIEGYPEPEDFDAFWIQQKKRLSQIPLRYDLVPVPSEEPSVEVFDVKVDCLGKSVSGYFCKPKNAAEKSLPAYVSFHGYGVGSANIKYEQGQKMLAFDINAHGIENGQPNSYYQNLRDNELKSYGLIPEGNIDRETCYWNGMVLRILRALEFIKSQKEWDGKTLIVTGGSQGGFQCLVAAALDHDVSECVAHVPWLADLSGKEIHHRIPSIDAPSWTPALGYYDTANHAKRIQCKTTIYAGLGDYDCPPSGQFVMFNSMKAPRTLEFRQGKTHGFTMPGGTVTTLDFP